MSAGTRDSAAASTGPVRDATGIMETKVGAGEPEGTATGRANGRHAPGPLYATEPNRFGTVHVRTAETPPVAVAEVLQSDTRSDALATGRLFAAAPDLLEALEYIVGPGAPGWSVKTAYEMASTAIAKARGQS